MRAIIIIITFLFMGITYADDSPQRVCVVIDQNAGNSIWTKRDNTAKMHIDAKYNNLRAHKGDPTHNRTVYVGSHSLIELRYGQPAVCENVKIIKGLPNNEWYFARRIKVGVQYGGDCEFDYQPARTINVTIHHRRGDLINPWSCTHN